MIFRVTANMIISTITPIIHLQRSLQPPSIGGCDDLLAASGCGSRSFLTAGVAPQKKVSVFEIFL
jgi:hypothetical protein